MRMKATQYTVRGVPPEVDHALRERAKSRKISINQVIVEELSKATIGSKQFSDFSDLVGRWTPDPAFDEVAEGQRQVHPEDWH